MKILVLGSSAGGGFPQWNCRCKQCEAFRRGELGGAMRTQSSVAVSQDGQSWVLLNASPDIAQQIRVNPALQPNAGTRDTPIKAVVLMDSQLQNVAGLISLREGNGLEVYATPLVFEDLTSGLPLLNALQHYCAVRWHMLPVAGAAPALPGGGALVAAVRAHAAAPITAAIAISRRIRIGGRSPCRKKGSEPTTPQTQAA